jgi:hypothetical protein
VRDKLSYTPKDVFACVFSMSGYSEPALQEFCSDRTREIILFNAREMRAIVKGAITFEELLIEKRDVFKVHAEAWFWDSEDDVPSWSHLRSGPDTFRVGREARPWLLCETGHEDAIFSTETIDFRGRAMGAVHSLYMRLNVRTIPDLRRLLQIADNQLGLTIESSFAIHQQSAGWFGFGTENFVTAVEDRQARYQELNWNRYHHSEELGFVSPIKTGGMFCLSSRQSTASGNHIDTTEVEVLMPGIPVDMSNIKRFCRLMGSPDAIFETVQEYPVSTVAFHPGTKVEPIATIISTWKTEKWTSGFVARNPFRGKKPPFVERDKIDHVFWILRNHEFLFCTLRSWHPSDQLMDHYRLCFVEGGFLGHYPVFWIVCDWPMGK